MNAPLADPDRWTVVIFDKAWGRLGVWMDIKGETIEAAIDTAIRQHMVSADRYKACFGWGFRQVTVARRRINPDIDYRIVPFEDEDVEVAS